MAFIMMVYLATLLFGTMMLVGTHADLSPAPTTEVAFTGTYTSTAEVPAPSPTTSFDFVYIYADMGCADYCNIKFHLVGEGSDCTCGEDCADGSDKYGTCCDYVSVCLSPTTTPAATVATTIKDSTVAVTTLPDVSSTADIPCPSTCTVSDVTCDEMAPLGFTCGQLEQNGCDCNGCECLATTPPFVSTVKSTLPASPTTTPKVSTTPPIHSTTEPVFPTLPPTAPAPTTTTLCDATCYGLSCDDWVPFGEDKINTRCTYLEKVHDCDCTGCYCEDEQWSTFAGSTNSVPDTTTTSTTTTTTQVPDFNFGIDTSVIGGGYSNTAIGKYSVIGGGRGNADTAMCDVAVGGVQNSLRSNYASVGGGFQNTVLGRFAAVPGGRFNSVAGRHTVLLGSNAATLASQGAGADHVLIMNFKNPSDGSGTVRSTVETDNTISLQADEIFFNDVDMVASASSARRLAKTQDDIEAVVERIDILKATLRERLGVLQSSLDLTGQA